MVNVDRN